MVDFSAIAEIRQKGTSLIFHRAKGLAPWIYLNGLTQRVDGPVPHSGTSPLAPPTPHSPNHFHHKQQREPHAARQQHHVSHERPFVVPHVNNLQQQPAVLQSVSYSTGPNRPLQVDEEYRGGRVDPQLAEVGRIFDSYSRFVDDNLNSGAADVSILFNVIALVY
jgi:hypothetical protein